MNHNNKRNLAVLMGLIATFISLPTFALTVSGGAMTMNIDATQLAAGFTHDDSSRPAAWLEEYFDASQAASRTPNQLLADHIVPSVVAVSGVGRQFTVNNPTTTGNNIANDFSFNANDLTGSAAGAIGLGGAMRFRLDAPFTLGTNGEEIGNRVITAYYSLEFDSSRTGTNAGYSGWSIFQHHSFRGDVFDLDNVVTTLTGNTLTLTGDLAMASGFNHLGGVQGSIIGDFSFQTTVVPVPAAVWLFLSGFVGLFASRHANKRSAA